MTYVLDTNIVSEVFKKKPNHEAIWWMQDFAGQLYITTVTIMELYYGILRLPDGKRKKQYLDTVDAIMREEKSRTYDFDGFSAYLCADIRRKAEAVGRTPQIADAMIAAICKRHDATLVTHNVKDFDYMDVKLLDPFDYEPPILAELRRREAEGAK